MARPTVVIRCVKVMVSGLGKGFKGGDKCEILMYLKGYERSQGLLCATSDGSCRFPSRARRCLLDVHQPSWSS